MLKRGIVSYKNKDRDDMEEGGAKALAIKELKDREAFLEKVYGATSVPSPAFLESNKEYMASRGRPMADLAAQVNPLDAERKYKVFEHELVRYMCMVVGGQIWVVGMDNDWELVDVLLGSDEVLSQPHKSKRRATITDRDLDGDATTRQRDLFHSAEVIECFDVAESSKDIVTYSTITSGGPGE